MYLNCFSWNCFNREQSMKNARLQSVISQSKCTVVSFIFIDYQFSWNLSLSLIHNLQLYLIMYWKDHRPEMKLGFLLVNNLWKLMFTIIYDTTELHQAEYNPLHNVDSSFLFLLVHVNANDILNPKTKVLDLTRLT